MNLRYYFFEISQTTAAANRSLTTKGYKKAIFSVCLTSILLIIKFILNFFADHKSDLHLTTA